MNLRNLTKRAYLEVETGYHSMLAEVEEVQSCQQEDIYIRAVLVLDHVAKGLAHL